MSPRLRAAALLPLVLVASCAAVDREIVIRTDPPNARIFDGDVPLSPRGGPGRYKLDPSRDHALRVEADGYEPQRLNLVSTVSGLRVTLVVVETLCLSIIVLPLLWPTWIATGYWYEFEPEEPVVRLVKTDGSSSSSGSAPTVATPALDAAVTSASTPPDSTATGTSSDSSTGAAPDSAATAISSAPGSSPDSAPADARAHLAPGLLRRVRRPPRPERPVLRRLRPPTGVEPEQTQPPPQHHLRPDPNPPVPCGAATMTDTHMRASATGPLSHGSWRGLGRRGTRADALASYGERGLGTTNPGDPP